MCSPSVAPSSPGAANGPESALQKFSNLVDSSLSGFFGNLGESLGNRPGTFMIFSLLLTMAACSGFGNFVSENRSDKLWIPQGTEAQSDGNRYGQLFDNPFFVEYFILEPDSGDMLSKDNLLKLMEIHDSVEALNVTRGEDGYKPDKALNLNNLCFELYGGGHKCFISSVLEHWNYDYDTLNSASDTEIQTTLKTEGDVTDLENYLAGFTILDNGDYSATAAKITYFLENREVCEKGDCKDLDAATWEMKFLEVGEDCVDGMTCYRFAGRSFSDEFGGAIGGDVVLMNIGFLIIIIYLAVNLSGRWCDFLGSKINLSLMSVLAVGMAIASSMGVSQLCGWKYTPVHTVLPFVLLGLGVDDSFVIMNSFDQTDPDDKLPKRMREAMSHAGVSITVTSLTDFVAFIISTATSLPALASFCFYAATGILFLFLYQCTFFGAFVIYDARHTANRQYTCCGIKAKPNPEREAATKEYNAKPSTVTAFMKNTYGPLVVNKTFSGVIAVFAISLLAVGCWGASSLKVDSNQLNFAPDSSYIRATFEANEELFGGDGSGVSLVIEDIDYFEERKNIYDCKAALEGKAHLQSFDTFFESWFHDFVDYNAAACYGGCVGTNSMDANGLPDDEDQFYTNLASYLSGPGGMYTSSVVWEDETTKTKIRGSKIGMKYDAKINYNAQLQVEAMTQLRDEVEKLNFDAYVYTFEFSDWETFIVIGYEMVMNVSLCMLAVLVITLILIAHPITAGLVFFCVACAIIEILGAMHFWGLIIDNVSVINLTLAVGLAVDYSAHVGHCFMVKHATTKSERVILALEDIGAAVLNGAISTTLAVVCLSMSDSYVFRVLFKQFFLTCIFGVFNGMVFLPVLLMWFGPEPYASAVSGGHGGGKAGGAKVVDNQDSMELANVSDVKEVEL